MLPVFARPYTIPISIGATTAQIDIFEILAGAGKAFVILGWEFSQTSEVGDAQEEVLSFVLKRAVGTVTSGSGGGTATPALTGPNGVASGATVETGNTTKLVVGTGTLTTLKNFGWYIRNPFVYAPTPENWLTFDGATRAVLELTKTPADQIDAIIGYVDIAELI